ncbi:MAG: aspartate kinase [Eubacteriales bacterium]|nr:aspartate kinase [Eubacteriales bacterium]
MSLYVQKFGGSSVANTEKMLHAAYIIKNTYEEGNDVIVVLSAQGDTTDHLLSAAREISSEPSLRELDALLSTGEQTSVALCAMALHTLGVPAVSLCAWQVPILTVGEHGGAEVSIIGRDRVERELREHRVVLIAGFQGVNENGDVTTLGRGGSDLSAVAMSEAFHADRCQIYTDVAGIYTTDPRICPEAKHLDRISYDEMLLLSQKGAQVLHDKSVALAKRCSVLLEVRSCEAEGDGSIVTAQGSGDAVTGVTKKICGGSELAGITAVGQGLPSAETVRVCIEALERQGITVYGVEEGKAYLTIFVQRSNADEALCIVHHALLSC